MAPKGFREPVCLRTAFCPIDQCARSQTSDSGARVSRSPRTVERLGTYPQLLGVVEQLWLAVASFLCGVLQVRDYLCPLSAEGTRPTRELNGVGSALWRIETTSWGLVQWATQMQQLGGVGILAPLQVICN
jgi:hypothetical protein